jgi:hypothetical protein
MTEQHLTDLLERLGDRVEVSSPPTAAMTRAADRTRRRRTAWVVGSAAAAVAVVAAGTQVVGDGLTDSRDSAPSSPAARPVPEGMRLVGIGHAAIAVPEEWERNHLGCGTPTADTFILDVSVTPACLIPRPAGVDAVWLSWSDRNRGFSRGEDIEIDGVPAKRTSTNCSPGRNEQGIVTCTASVYVPSAGVGFQASSSTNRERVDELLDEVRILDGKVGVPPYNSLTWDMPFKDYARHLREFGLEPVRVERRIQGPAAGMVIEASPGSGTVLPEGSAVRVFVQAPKG